MATILPTEGTYNLPSYIGINSTDSPHGVFPSILQEGGYQEMATIADRDAIPMNIAGSGPVMSPDGMACGRRRLGMTVYVIEEDAAYRLVPAGYFGNEGQANLANWNSLDDNQKAVLLDPSVSYTVPDPNGGLGATINVTGSGNADDCWVRIYPEDVDGTLPLGGSAGQVVMKSPDGQAYEVEWTDWVAGSVSPREVFARMIPAGAYRFVGGTVETKTVAEASLPGIKSTLNKFGYANSDITAWKVNYKLVFNITSANADPCSIEAWVSDEDNGTNFHPGTWSAHETQDTTSGNGRAYTITGEGLMLRDQGSGNDLATGENIRLRISVITDGVANDDIDLLHVYFEVNALLDADLKTLSNDSAASLRSQQGDIFGTVTNRTYGPSADTADSAPDGPDGGGGTPS